MALIREYFPEFSDVQIALFDKLEEKYKEWNAKINVVSRKDIDNILERHILHSLAIAKFFAFKKGVSVLDVGTGGGLPGIPLSIAFPNARFHLIDGTQKKIKVVDDIIQSLGLTNVTCAAMRSEEVKGTYNFVVSRAVTAFPRFVEMTRHCVAKESMYSKKNGILYLKGGDFQEEISPFGNRLKVFNVDDVFEGDFFQTKKVIYLPVV